MNKKDSLFLFSTFLIIVLDQITKFIIEKTILMNSPITIIPKLLQINYIHNFGAGFGIFQGQRWMLIFISFIAIGLILYYYDKIPNIKYVKISTALIIGGAAGNLIDRIFLGYVVDFIDLMIWPAFNIADSAITIGAVGIMIYIIKDSLKKKKD